METTRQAFQDLRGLLDWAPDTVVATIILGIAVLVALGLHNAAMSIVRRLSSRWQHPFTITLITETRNLSRVALLVVILGLALPAAPLDPEARFAIGRILLVTFIALIGWGTVVAAHIASDLYLRRFRLDAEDNLLARKHITQVRIMSRTIDTLIVIVTIAAALMTFDSVRQYGVSLFASAGVAGIVAGLAARPVLSNLFAGIQLAVTQPIRIDDAVMVQGEFGRVEEITSTYVVLRLWDLRRLIVPLTFFIEQPFQNWTRDRAGLVGTVLLYLDYTAPVARIREKAEELAKEARGWDGKVITVQVTNAREATMEVRILIGAISVGISSDLTSEIREKMIDFLQREYPGALPRSRQQTVGDVIGQVTVKPDPNNPPAANSHSIEP